MHTARQNLSRNLWSSAAVAAALVALASAGPAHAQGVNGTGQVVSGTATITTSPNQTRVQTTSGQTVINWRPTDNAPAGGPIDFLPVGRNWQFEGNGSYVVLNRFLGLDPITGAAIPISRQIGLYGTISSTTGVSGPQGGNIWFYNAGGFLIGSTGVINVGSLVLTSNDIDTTGGLLGPGGSIRFRGASASTSTVEIAGGARINVSNPVAGSAYMAVVAPRIVQRGRVDVDGSVAYVAAEQADITINNGLFDINVLVGAEGGTVIDHSGVTTGTAQRDADGRDSRIYMVAMPKNDAVTMLVAGQIGYRDPVTAQVEPNGAIRLAAGYNVFGGELAQNPGSAAPANMVIQDSIFTSELRARASNNLDAAPVATIPTGGPFAFVPPPQLGLLRFNQNATLSGDNRATITIGNQQSVIAAQNLSLISGGRNGAPGLAQVALQYAGAQPGNRPAMQVGGTLLLDASVVADPFAGGDATGGTARLSVNGGVLVATDIELRADGTAGYGTPLQGGIGRGGTTEFIADGAGSSVTVNGLRMNADGRGGGRRFNQNLGLTEVSDRGGLGAGGTALMSVSGGAAFTAQQGLSLSAVGFGDTGTTLSGNGVGGLARLAISGGASRVTTPFTLLDTLGAGGGTIFASPANINSARGGDGFGGTSEIISDGNADLGGTFLQAEGVGGSASINPNRGGDGIGGNANLLVSGGTVQLAGLTIDVDGLAGGGSMVGGATQSTHGVGHGGASAVRADIGSIIINGNATITGNGNTVAGAGVNTLERRGGSVELRASTGGNILIGGTLFALVDAGFDPSLGGDEGTNLNAVAGSIRISGIDGGSVSAAGMDLRAVASTANATGAIGSATGGSVTLEARGNGRVISGVGNSVINVSALAGSGPLGGQGLGGRIDVIADGGRIDLGTVAQFDANGTSGVSNGSIAGPIGLGGTIRLQTTASTAPSEILFADLFATMNGRSGEVIEGGIIVSGNAGGAGRGGAFILDMAGGSIGGNSLIVQADGSGGASNAAQGGGDGTGGTVDLSLTGGTLDVDFLGLSADGRGERGGSNQRSGQGIGGRVTITVDGGTMDTTLIEASAQGYGGAGRDGADTSGTGGALVDAGDGGRGVGGDVVFNANSGIVRAGNIRVNAGGTGGNGGAFDAAVGGTVRDTGDGGDGQAGSATFNLRGAAVTATLVDVRAQGAGGNGGALIGGGGLAGPGVGGNGGSGSGGQATFRIAGNAANIAGSRVNARGNGGAGADAMVGGDGGAAQAGTAQVIVDGVNAGLVTARLDATANGGDGGNGANGDGGDGGRGTGGTVRLTTVGAGAAASYDPGNLDGETRGGRGGNGVRDAALPAPTGSADGGDGGQAIGGRVELVAAQGTLTLVPRAGQTTAEILAYAVGGNGGNSGAADRAGNGGNATGPIVSLLASGGTLMSGGAPVRITAEAQRSRGGQTAGGATGNAGLATGGTINLRAQSGPAGNGAITLGATTLVAGSASGGRIDIRNEVAGDGIILAGLTATANGTPLAGGGAAVGDSGIYVDAGSGRVVVNGAAQLDTASSLTFAAQGGGSVQIGGTLGGFAGQRIDINHAGRTGSGATVRATGSIALNAGTDLASSGGLVLDSGGALSMTGTTSIALGDVTAATSIGATSGGNVTLGRATAGGTAIVQAGGIVTLTNAAVANDSISLRGSALNFGALTAANAISLTATGAGIASTAPIRAGTDLTVNAAGTIAIADARAGDDIRLTGTSMTLGDLRATGTGADNEADGSDFVINSTGDVFVSHAEARSDFRANAIRFATGLNSIITGGDIVINAVNTIDLGNSTAGGQIAATGSQIAFNTLVAGTDVRLTTIAGSAQGPSGPLGDGSIVGTSIGAGGLINANALGNLAVTSVTAARDAAFSAGGNVTLGALQAGGNALVYGNTATSLLTVGSISAGGFVEARAARLAFGNVTAATDVILSTFNGALSVGDVTAGDDIFLTVNGSNANPNSINPDSQTGVVSATQFALTAGNLRSTGLGSDTAASGPRTFGGAGPATNAIRVRASGNVQTGSVTTSGSAMLVSDLGAITSGNLVGTDGVGIFVRGNATLGNVTTNGVFWLGDSTQNFGIVPNYRVTNFASGQTATNGNATLGVVTAGLIRGATPGGLTYASLASAGDIFWTTFSSTSTNVGGAIIGGNISTGGSLNLSAGGDAALGTINSTGQILVQSAQQRVTAQSVSSNSNGVGSITLSGAAGVVVPTINSPGQVTLSSTNGAIRVANTIVAGGGVVADGQSVFLRAAGPLTVNNATARGGDVDVAATGNLTVQTANASNALILSSARTATINGVASGVSVNVAAADIGIGSGGRLGTLGTTQSVILTNNDRSATAFIGGTGTRNGWHLDSGEVQRLFGANITIDGGRVTAPQSTSVGSARAPDVFIDDFTVNAAQQFGATGTFAITTPGKLRVVGDARFTNMADGQSVRLRADDALEIILGDGSVVLTGAGTELGGVLRLQSEDVIVATLRAIADVAAAPTVAAINDRLAQNDGITSDLGALAAKGIDVSITRGFYVQNSGAPGAIPGRDYANRRGLSFGALGLNIATRDATNRIVINGQQLGGPRPVTGLDMIALIGVNGVVGATNGFDPASTANGCIIINIGPCRVGPDDGGFPLRDILGDDGEPGDDGVGGNGVRPVPLITLRGLDPLTGEPLIDDPVTGAGNEDLWIPTE